MASWFSSCWIYLWIFILSRKVLADLASSPNYTINQTKVNFDQATEVCSPGVLTTLTTEQEATKILRLISMSVLPRNELRFWVGLRKAKNECVVPALPLRGFKWTEDGSEESQVSRWIKEPENTCTTVRCAALQVEVDQSAVTRWGLIPVSCKNTYKFICKLRDRQTKQTSEDRKTTTTPVTLEPVTPESAAPERPTLAAPEPPTPAAPEAPKLATRGPESKTDLKLKPEPEQQGPELGSGLPLGSDLCGHPNISGARFFSLDPNNSSRIKVKCWSRVQLELHCWGRPAVWHLLNDSPANFTTICQPCNEGFEKDAFGECVDIDECSRGSRCRYTCLNIEGSYKCVCYDEHGKYHNENSSACWLSLGILIPVLVAVVVLVLVVAVAVKCCLMRRSKKRAMKKSQKMAMKSDGQDSFATANEKIAT